MIQSNEEPFSKNHNDAETYREGQRGILCQKLQVSLTTLEQPGICCQWPNVYHEQLVEGQFQYCDAFCMLIAF